jgi:hypothetical protein
MKLRQLTAAFLIAGAALAGATGVASADVDMTHGNKVSPNTSPSMNGCHQVANGHVVFPQQPCIRHRRHHHHH